MPSAKGLSTVFRSQPYAAHSCSIGPQAETLTPPQVQLPEPVPGRVEALGEEGVLVVFGVDMRYSPGVNEDFHLAVQWQRPVEIGSHQLNPSSYVCRASVKANKP